MLTTPPPLLIERMLSTFADGLVGQPEDLAAAAAAEDSLREFVRQAWHVVEPATPYVHGWHLDAICDHLEAVSNHEIRNLLINIPPRHMKSLAVSVFWMAWMWIRNPAFRWLFASYAQSLSTRDSLKCRRLISSPWYQGNWRDRFQFAEDQNLKMRFDNTKTGYRLATSIGGLATGEGGDAVVLDDPHNVLESHSEAKRESVLTWWDETMSTRLNDPATGVKVIVMQRVHERDLSGHVLEQGGYEHLCLPARYEPRTHVTSIGWEDPRTEPGELLWPDRFSEEAISELERRLGSYAAAGQLQQRPAPSEGGMIKTHWWQFYSAPPLAFDQVVQSWDMTFKDTKSSDFVVGQVWGRVGADCYLLDQTRARLDFPSTLRAFEALCAAWPDASALYVEDAANGPAVIAMLRRKIAGIIAVTPEGGKVARAAAVSPIIEAGNVYLPDPSIAPWVDAYIHEFASFPNGANDDQVDATTQALKKLAGRANRARPRVKGRR